MKQRLSKCIAVILSLALVLTSVSVYHDYAKAQDLSLAEMIASTDYNVALKKNVELYPGQETTTQGTETTEPSEQTTTTGAFESDGRRHSKYMYLVSVSTGKLVQIDEATKVLKADGDESLLNDIESIPDRALYYTPEQMTDFRDMWRSDLHIIISLFRVSRPAWLPQVVMPRQAGKLLNWKCSRTEQLLFCLPTVTITLQWTRKMKIS